MLTYIGHVRESHKVDRVGNLVWSGTVIDGDSVTVVNKTVVLVVGHDGAHKEADHEGHIPIDHLD